VGAQSPSGDVMAPLGTPTTPAMNPDVIENLFTYHPPTMEQTAAYLEIRNAAKDLARVIDRVCPAGPDRTTAIRKIREAVMTANASIATNNASYR